MRSKRYVRVFTEDEKKTIETGLRSQDSFVLRRSQMLLFSSEGLSLDEIANRIGYHPKSVRLVIKRFDEEGVSVLQKGSRRPLTSAPAISEENAQKLKEFLRSSPREFNKNSSLWTLELLAEVSYEEGLSARKVSYETIRTTLKALDVNWKRAKHWIASSDPHYVHKKNAKNT
ncbi:MAG: helix-turn-helix domain containing protein [Anaerolineae bacterium]|jgi:transposase|nr:helix-turn-helix domain containing protein [Anaerolineae bacterium]MBT7602408.1 helix-turn-helix domain containing protein [Anaerolineae bacterium]MBT7988867.1 helix-turn-helix domain containing protein [Anaerolineae bacterium]